jgi:hypothetical protein
MTAKSSWLKTKGRKVTEPPAPSRQLKEPTPEDIRNGWTPETLTAYHETVVAPEIAALFGPRKSPRPTQVNRRSPHGRLSYSPFDYLRRRK